MGGNLEWKRREGRGGMDRHQGDIWAKHAGILVTFTQANAAIALIPGLPTTVDAAAPAAVPAEAVAVAPTPTAAIAPATAAAETKLDRLIQWLRH